MAGYTGDYLAAAAAAVQRNAMPKPYPPYGPWEYPSLEYNPYMPEMYAYEQALIPSALAQAFALPFCDFQLLNPDPNMFSMQQQQMLQNLQNAQQGLRPPMPQGFQSTMPNPMGSGLQPTIQQSMSGMRFMPGAMPADSPFVSNPSSNGLASSSAPPKPATEPEPASIPPVPAMPQPTMSGAFPTPQAGAPPPPMLSLPPGYPSGYPYPGQSQLPYFRDPTLGLPPGVPSPYAFPPQPGPFPQGIDYSNMNMPKPADPSTKHNCNDEDDGGDELTARALKRPRLVWTPQLHKKFEESVHKLGVDKAVPKTIMQLMNIDGLTRENVASHLQKYRLHLKKQEQSEEKDQADEQKSAPSSPSKQ